MKTRDPRPQTRNSFWQRIFQLSKVNGAEYLGEQLPRVPWNWPKGTFLDRRLAQKRVRARPGQRDRDGLATGLLIFGVCGFGLQIVRWALTRI